MICGLKFYLLLSQLFKYTSLLSSDDDSLRPSSC